MKSNLRSLLADAPVMDELRQSVIRQESLLEGPAESLQTLDALLDGRESAIAPTTVTGPDDLSDPVALAQLTSPDEEYLRTSSSNHFTLDFSVGGGRGESRVFLLASQGYYTEWVRGEWIKTGTKETTFRPGDEALLEALTRWRSKQSELETAFYSTRIPVR